MLRFENVSVSRGRRNIFSGISGQCEQGKLVALVGENGAGKSTLLHALSGDLACEGDIALHGRELKFWTMEELATQRAVLTQHHSNAFAFGIPEIIAMGRHLFTESRAQCHKRVQQYIKLLSLEHLLDRTTQQLSGGELQRVHMAKCLAQLDAFAPGSSNKLMLLDEPTSALDLRHQHRLLQLVRTFVDDGNTAIVAIHDLNLAALYADHVLILHEGKLHAHGNPDSVFTESTLGQVYQTPMHISEHPTLNYKMIFSEPQELSHEITSFN